MPKIARRRGRSAAGRPKAARTGHLRGREKPAIVGTSVKRLDGPDKVAGRAKYIVRHQPSRDDLRQDPALAARARADRRDRSVGGAESAPGVKAALA